MGYDWFALITINVGLSSNSYDYDNKFWNEMEDFCSNLAEEYDYEYGRLIGCVHHTKNGTIQDHELNMITGIVDKLVRNFPELAFDLYTFEFDGEQKYKKTIKMINNVKTLLVNEEFGIQGVETDINSVKLNYNLSKFFCNSYPIIEITHYIKIEQFKTVI